MQNHVKYIHSRGKTGCKKNQALQRSVCRGHMAHIVTTQKGSESRIDPCQSLWEAENEEFSTVKELSTRKREMILAHSWFGQLQQKHTYLTLRENKICVIQQKTLWVWYSVKRQKKNWYQQNKVDNYQEEKYLAFFGDVTHQRYRISQGEQPFPVGSKKPVRSLLELRSKSL